MFDDRDDVGRVASASAFGMVGVNGTALEGCDRGLNKSALIECVGVDTALNIQLITSNQTGVDCGRRGAPILMDLETAGAGDDLFTQRTGVRVATLASNADVDRKRVGCLEHGTHIMLAGRAGCRVGASAVGDV